MRQSEKIIYVLKQKIKENESTNNCLQKMMTNGIGASIGTYVAGKVVNHFCMWNEQGYLVSRPEFNGTGWDKTWLIFAGYALVVAVLFAIVFRYKHQPQKA